MNRLPTYSSFHESTKYKRLKKKEHSSFVKRWARGGGMVNVIYKKGILHRGVFCQVFSGGVTTMIVINPPKRKLANIKK